MKKVFKSKHKYFTIFIMLLLSLLVISGCAKKANKMSTAQPKISDTANVAKNDAISPNTPVNQDKQNAGAKTEANYENIQSTSLQERKITKNATMQMETLKFDETLNSIMENVKQSGAYLESSSISGSGSKEKDFVQNRTARLVIKVPKQNFDLFLTSANKTGNVLSTKTLSDDITSQYFDTEAHVKSLKIQEERLLELLKKSGELKDILQIETELSNVRYKIENLTGTLKKWDNMVDYSNVTIEILEVQETQKLKSKPVSLWEKIKYGFTSSLDLVINMLKGLLVSIFATLPFLIIFTPLFFLIRFIIKFATKKRGQ